ncbi:hypothetical protein GSI_03285 [Ganoderma sinense ZZ0214-1]|uniref:Ricin B lectin domain-containing protein n=1 Tax=Ganoderma sinense ZZ0214-1 TaxID=1077348 RepID=A0A2G8SLQ9_9APHY|nr:hypothetical protein GSI_03285 [Ganoderma sinense ZZ0214-1]
MVESNKTYKIVSAKTGTVLDLSISDDNKSLIGDDWQGSEKQKWHLVQEDEAWIIKNVSTGRYLGIEGVAANNLSVVATYKRFRWDIWPDEDDSSTYRLFVPNTHFNVDLFGGNAAPGTRVIVWEMWHPGQNQTWRFEPEA